MTALNLTPDQERIAAVDWAEREYRNVDEFTGNDLDIAIKAYIAGRRAALAQSPVSVENERRLEIALMERNFERAKCERIMKVMMSVFSLIHMPDDIKLPDGRVMRFNDPNAAETLRALGKAILAIPAAIAAAANGTTP